MPSTYSTNLKIELIATGEQSGTWGTTTNTNLGTLLEEAIAGYVTQAVTDGAATVLTIPNGASSNGRNYVIELTGALTANRTVEVPAVDKPYIFFNNTTGGFSVTVKVSGQTGVTIANGKKAIVYTNSIDVIEVANAPVTEAGTQTLTNKTLTSPALSGNVVLTSNSSSDAFRITQTGAGNALVVEDSANPDATPFVVTATGNVGIGTSSPGALLTVFGTSAPAARVQDATSFFEFYTNGGTSVLSNAGAGALIFNNNGSERMRITSAGDVGIGTTSPNNSRLHVLGSGATQGLKVESTSTTQFDGAQIYLRGAAGTVRSTGFFHINLNAGGTNAAFNINSYGSTDNFLSTLASYVYSDDSWRLSTANVERMRITSAGRVGIGTSSPAVSLAVSSTDSILVPVGTTAERPAGATGYLRFNTTTTSFEGYNGTSWGSIGGGATGGGSDAIFYNNGQTVTTNYSIPSGQNAGTFGPITINSGVTVTVPSGSTWSIV